MYTAVHMVVIGALKDTHYDPDEKRAVLSQVGAMEDMIDCEEENASG